MLLHVLNTLAPVFLVVALGAGLRAARFLDAPLVNGLNRLTFWVALPALLFHKIASATFEGGPVLRVLAAVVIGTVAVALVAAALVRLLKLPPGSRGVFVQGAFRGNLAYVGLAVLTFSMGSGLGEVDGPMTTVVLVLAPVIPLYNAVSVWLLVRDRETRLPLRNILGRIATNPLLIACVLGLPFGLLDWSLPSAIDRTLAAIAQSALPLALLAIGASLTRDRIRGNIGVAVTCSLLKTFLAPLAGWLAALALDLPAQERLIVLVLLATPTAVASYVMAQQLESDDALAGSTIVLSTILSAVSLTLAVMLS